MQELSLDILPHSVSFPSHTLLTYQEMMDLTRLPDLSHLHTLSLSFSSPSSGSLDITNLPSLPHLPKLSSLHLTLSGEKRTLPPTSLTKLLSEVQSPSLKRLSLLNLIITWTQLSTILDTCPNLEELYVTISSRQTLLDCPTLMGCGLRVFHANAPPEAGPTSDDLVELARGMPSLDQIGSGNRVYEIWRSLGDNGEKVVELCRWGRITTPAYFQIWRG
jgi:hypothetical protein